ncbi:hypothetical protein O7600_01295 [Micromonospora sp. WMMA1998]|uniref:hypothetical protein n=1 Tax=Micromonospora sp. WMMA1998 TaxID=3015167 RepID=UPI00248D14BE|nr:hypothetical protein [Micromonospora sp. WMMA1998]WBC15499.1 hypothetical protein O7600_01295 [Micromonospora sp. WMMA1998]
MAGFCFKTTWLAVRGRTVREVADALDLRERETLDTERVPDYHLWARAVDGELLRAYCYLGERGEVPLVVGEPTAVEIDRGVGVRRREPGMEHWSDDEWDRWHEAIPDEFDVMAIAGRWSVDPSRIDDATVTGDGIFGRPPTGPKGTWGP